MALLHYRTSDRTAVSVGPLGAFGMGLLWLCWIIVLTTLICLGLLAIGLYAAATVAVTAARGGNWRATWARRRAEIDGLSERAPWRRPGGSAPE